MNEIYHILAHGTAMDPVNESSVLVAGVFGFHFFHDLLSERAHFRRAGNRHVLVALVPGQKKMSWIH